MKTNILVLSLLTLISVSLHAQKISEDQIPAVVSKALHTKFPDTLTKLEWEMKGELYKAEFKVGKHGHDVWIDKSGAIKKLKEDFPKGQLPEVIKKKLEKDYATYKVDDVDKLEENSKITYLVKLDGTTDDLKITFSNDGQVLESKKDKSSHP